MNRDTGRQTDRGRDPKSVSFFPLVHTDTSLDKLHTFFKSPNIK